MMEITKTLGKLEKTSGCVKNDVLSTAFCYDRYPMGMEEVTGFGMKNSLTLPSLANKHLNSLRYEDDEPIYI